MRLPGVFAKLLLCSIVLQYLQQAYPSATYKTFTISKSTKNCVDCSAPEQRWNCEGLWEDLWNIHKVTPWHLILAISQFWFFSLCMQKTPTKQKNYCAVSLALTTNDIAKNKGFSDENTFAKITIPLAQYCQKWTAIVYKMVHTYMLP